jgi:hypothetical protein
MVIALLAVLGVDLIMIVAFFGVVLSRRRWVSRQPGAFKAGSGWWTVRCRGWAPSGSGVMAAGSVTCWSAPRCRSVRNELVAGDGPAGRVGVGRAGGGQAGRGATR